MIFLSSSELVLSIQSYNWSWQEPGWAAISGYEDVLDSWRDSSLGGFQHWSCQHCGEQLLTPVSLQCAAGNVWGWISTWNQWWHVNQLAYWRHLKVFWIRNLLHTGRGQDTMVFVVHGSGMVRSAWMLAAKQEQLMPFEFWIGGSCTCNWFCQDFRGLITVVSLFCQIHQLLLHPL